MEDVYLSDSEVSTDSDISGANAVDLDQFLSGSDSENEENFLGFDGHGGAVNLGDIGLFLEPDNNLELPCDVEIGWSKDDTKEPMRPFEGETGLQHPMDSHDPIDFFYLLFEEDMWNTLVQQTNLYFTQSHPDLDTLSPHSRSRKWKVVTVDEMKVFMAISIAMGLVVKQDIEQYWSTDEIDGTPFFGKYMSRDRYHLILWNLHVSDNTNEVEHGMPGFDPLNKVRPFIKMMRSTFRDVYTPSQNLSFDEGSCPWKGRLKWRVYNPSKPNKFHMKFYQVCEAETGWVSGFDIYTGTTECAQYAEAVTDQDLTDF
jgi:hypothetical protein